MSAAQGQDPAERTRDMSQLWVDNERDSFIRALRVRVTYPVLTLLYYYINDNAFLYTLNISLTSSNTFNMDTREFV